MKKKVTVVAAIIENEQREVFCALRSPEMSIPNMWEFPGGKVEPGEDFQEALEREITEEFSCSIKALDVFHKNVHEYETFIIELIVLKAMLTKGMPVLTEHSQMVWLKRENLASLVWAPADIPAVEELMREVTI